MRTAALGALARAVALADVAAWEGVLGDGWRHALARRQIRRALSRARGRVAAWAPAIPAGPASQSVAPVPTDSAAPADPIGARVFLLQLAWLGLARERVTYFDPTWVAQRYYAVLEARRRSEGARRRRVVLALVGLVVAGAAGLTIALATGGDEPPHAAGATLAETAETAWAEAVTDWVVGLDRYARARADGDDVATARAELGEFEARVLAPEVRAFFGPDASEALGDLIAAARSLAVSQHFERDDEALGAAILAANHALARSERAYFFDGHGAIYPDGRVETRVFLFRVAVRRRWVDDAAGVSVDAVHLRRLDRVNLVQLLIGYTSRRMDVAVVLLDKVEEILVQSLLPSLPTGAERPIGSASKFAREERGALARDELLDEGAKADLEKLGAAAIRDVVGRAFPDALPRLAAVGRVLAARNAAFEEAELLPPRGLHVSATSRAHVDAALSVSGRTRVADAEAQLALPDIEAAALALLARSSLGVEHHEVQHRLDYALGDAFAPPAELLAVMGVAPDAVTHDERDPVMHTAHELSAYTAELARDPAWALVNLQSLIEQSLDGDSDEFRTSLLLLGGLQEVLAVEPRVAVVDLAAGEPTRVALTRALLAIAPRGADAIANGARTLYERWFGRPVPTLRLSTGAAEAALPGAGGPASPAAGDAIP